MDAAIDSPVVDAPVVAPKVTVTIQRSGDGTITGTGVNCTDLKCEVDVDAGSDLVLQAMPGVGSDFKAWSGCSSTNGPSCTLSAVSTATTVTATFNIKNATFAIVKDGNGSGTVAASWASGGALSCGATCSGVVPKGTVVTLTGTPDAGSTLVWGVAGCSGTGPCMITVGDGETDAKATFTLSKYPLTVSLGGPTGTGSVISNTAGVTISCGTTCAASVDYGTSVQLVASGSGTGVFSSWTGCSSVANNNTCNITIGTGPNNVTAAFKLKQGLGCGLAGDCSSGFCTDGVCCSTGPCGVCKRCNINGTGTCSAAASDSACAPSVPGCTMGCDGAGNCAPAPAGTACSTPVCTGSTSYGGANSVGVYTSTSYMSKKCDGVAASATSCKTQSDNGCGNYGCASGTACKTICTVDADCTMGNRCSNGSCVPKFGIGAVCDTGEQCGSGACVQKQYEDTSPVCHECTSHAQCPMTSPICFSDSWTCAGCGTLGDSSYCNADNSLNCTNIGCYSSSARDCGKRSANHCSCGTGLDSCPSWMICLNSTCKVAGGHPCQSSSDCAYGSCLNGVCQKTASGGYCIGDIPDECASGTCSAYVPVSGVFFFDGSTCQ